MRPKLISQSTSRTPTVALSGVPAGYTRLQDSFGWHVPKHFNIAQACCTRWAQSKNATKLIAINAYGYCAKPNFYTYFQLQEQANRLSHVLAGLGVGLGDRVAIVMPQCFETAVAYMAVLQMGAVAVPLSLLFGPEALEFRLQDCEAVVAICDVASLANVYKVRTQCPLLRSVMAVGNGGEAGAVVLEQTDARLNNIQPSELQSNDIHYTQALALAPPHFAPVDTLADDAAILIYTSGTTGNPKGALIPHRALIGNLSGFVCSQNWFGFDPAVPTPDHALPSGSKAVFWSPADWAWTGGLMDALLPTLYFGRPIVAYSGRFSPQTALELMGQCGVTHTFIFPTALKAMAKAYPGTLERTVRQQFGLQLQALMSAGEAVGDAVFGYCAQQLGVQPNEMFGQTEVNYIVGNCAPALVASAFTIGWPAKPGSMGMGYPGHRVAVIDEAGQECAPGVAGEVALHRFNHHGQLDPIVFLGYWKNEAGTRAKFTRANDTGAQSEDDWCRTGDLAVCDADGYLWYQGRADDVFKCAGYRIGPGEIENCLVKHPAVVNAAVVPKPDAERGAVVKAYVVVAPHLIAACAGSESATAQLHAQLTTELQAHVKGQLAPYEYPKEIEFVDALPMTTSGKVQRRVLRLQEEQRYSVPRVGQVAGVPFGC